MADGDIIHKNLPKRFLNLYSQLCEGHWDASDLGYRALHPLKRQIREYGNSPIQLGGKIATILEQTSVQLLEGESVNWSEARNQIAILGRGMTANCNPRGKDMVLEAGHLVLLKIQNGLSFEDMKTEVIKGYFDSVYKNDFEHRLQQTPKHYKDALPSEVERRKEEIRPYVEIGISDFAKQAARRGDVSHIRRHRALKQTPPDLYDAAW
jgi:hypothetical protein